VQVFVAGPVEAHVAFASQPPLPLAQLLMGEHVFPSPEYPPLQAQELVPGPVDVQVALASHPPLAAAQVLIGAQVIPSPV
jgi:hypothetical protein